MRRLGFAVFFGAVGFVLAAAATAVLVSSTSSNTHDLSLETVMTAFFVGGPLGGIVGAIVGAARGKPKVP